MLRKLATFILHRRLEDVLAGVFVLGLLIFFLTHHVSQAVPIGGHDVAFLLLPIGVLGLKCLFDLLFASDSAAAETADVGAYLANFFRPLARLFRDWCPFVLLSACYYAMFSNFLFHLNPRTADTVLARFDAAIFGSQPSFLLEKWISPWATDLFNFIYFSYVLSLPAVAIYCYTRREKEIFRRVMMGYLTLMLMGVSSYLCVPAIGPGSFFADRYTQDLNGHALSKGVNYIIRNGRVAYDCFPSLHVGIPLLLCFYLRDYQRRLLVPAALYVFAMCGTVIYLRYHYVADVLAAFVFAPIAYWLNDFLLARWPGERIIAVGQTVPQTAILPDVEPT